MADANGPLTLAQMKANTLPTDRAQSSSSAKTLFGPASSVVVCATDESRVNAFIAEKQLLSDLGDALSLVTDCFKVAGPLSLTVEEDADAGATWLEIRADAYGSVRDLMDARHRFHREFRARMPSRIRENVRLYLTSAED